MTGSSEGALAAIPMLRRHAILLLGNRNIADEMVGRCLVDGMKLLNGTRDGTAIRNVLLKILHARCQEELDVNASRGLAASGIGVTRADGAPDASTIEAVFDQLGFGDRAILLLISLERISYEDAAEILAIPLVVVASKVAGARRALNALSEVVKPPDPVRIR